MTDAHNNPIGIIIVGHGNFGAAILRAAEIIMGPQEDCVSISVDVAHDVEEAVRRLQDASERLDRGGGVIVLTDMFGGTPTNLALSLQGQHNAEVITGVNLPMLLKVIENRNELSLADLARQADEAGKAGIVSAGEMLRVKSKQENKQSDKFNLQKI